MQHEHEQMLTREQWERVAPIILRIGKSGAHLVSPRATFEGILYRYKHEVGWKSLPEDYGNWKTIWRRHQVISANGDLARAVHALVDGHETEPNLDWLVPIAAKLRVDDGEW